MRVSTRLSICAFRPTLHATCATTRGCRFVPNLTSGVLSTHAPCVKRHYAGHVVADPQTPVDGGVRNWHVIHTCCLTMGTPVMSQKACISLWYSELLLCVTVCMRELPSTWHTAGICTTD